MENIRVLLADDHALVRTMLGERLQRESCIEVVGVTGTADQALTLAREQKPDVVILDIDMPGASSFEVARTLISERSDVRVLFLSAYMHDHYIEQALQVGAVGYLTKAEPPENVLTAIREVASGGAYFSEDVRRRLVFDADGPRLQRSARSRVSLLSARELEVLRHLARGLSKKEIASLLSVSVKTVEGHTEKLMRKLDIHDRVQLSRFAIREGLVEA